MTEEERQDEINKEFNKYIPQGTSFEKAYRKLKKYTGKYKNEFTNLLANMIIDQYCAGYFRYGKKQIDIQGNCDTAGVYHDSRGFQYRCICRRICPGGSACSSC